MPESSPRPACSHATLVAGTRCPGCGKLQTYLAAKGLLGPSPGPRPAVETQGPPLPTPIQRAWLDHPILALVRHRRRLAFFRQLHALLKAGQGLPVIFADLLRSAGNPAEKQALQTVQKQIDAGASFSEAARFDPTHFDPVTLELFSAAEASGSLVAMLERQIQRLEDAQRLRWKLVLASLYPMYLLGALVLAGPLLSLSSAVGPHGETDGLLPAYLHGVLRNSVLLLGVVAVVMAFPMLIAASGVESSWEGLKRRVPLVGGVLRATDGARFCEAFAAGTKAGLDAQRTMRLAARATGSALIEKALPEARAVLERGGAFADAVAVLAVLDGSALGQFATAERVGELDQVTAALAKEYGESASRQLAILVGVAVALTVVVGLIVVVSKILGTAIGGMNAYFKAADVQ